jgi:hypothetical protein
LVASAQAWLARQVLLAASCAQVRGLRQTCVALSQTVEPAQTPAAQAQPTMSLLQARHSVVESQYIVPSQATPPVVRHGQLAAPVTQVSATQVPLVQLRP